MRIAQVSVLGGLLAGALLGLAVLAGGSRATPATAEEGPAAKPGHATRGTVAMRYRPARTFRFDLPAEQFIKIGGAIDFREAGGARFVTEVEGGALKVDTDGDGTTDVKIQEGSGYVRLRTTSGFDYSLRVRNSGSGWSYAASGARVGKLGAARITLIDQDGDGRYDGYGRDAMIVGSSRSACFLSRVINVAGTLHSIEVSPDGSSLKASAYEGAAGTIDLARRWSAQARLQSAVLRSSDGAWSFDLASHGEGLRVPAGTYQLHGGRLGLGDSTVRFRQGKAKAIVVPKGKAVRVAGGGPLAAEFAYRRQGEELVFTPETLRWFGRAGEEYYAWKPFGNSPEFTITDASTKKEVAKAIFTGC